MNDDCALIIFSKAPVPGFAKTRLAPALGDAGAARLAARMLDETLQQAIASGIGPVELCCTPDMTHPAFISAHQRYGIILTEQGDGNLGSRMQRALERVLQSHQRVLLMGTDAPQLDAFHLRQAAESLRTHAAVFTPVSDGGYVLLGFSHKLPSLLDGILWGSNQVMQQTRKRLADLRITFAEMPALNDVDLPEDLVHVPSEWLA